MLSSSVHALLMVSTEGSTEVDGDLYRNYIIVLLLVSITHKNNCKHTNN